MQSNKGFLSITFSYLGFSLTDGAIRMLVVLYFHKLGFSPFEIAALFLLYEIAGIFTNFIGGWIGKIAGLNITLIAGMVLQILAMLFLTVKNAWLTVPYIMLMQGFSGVAKDLVKMSSKSSLKVLDPGDSHSILFRWVSILTGSKNALKGVGFLLGGFFLSLFGFQNSMLYMAIALVFLTIFTVLSIPANLGRVVQKTVIKQLFIKSRAINILSLARFFLFGSRDLWFVIGLPVFLQVSLAWSNSSTGAFLAFWVIGYGIVQSFVPRLFNGDKLAHSIGKYSVAAWTACLVIFPVGLALLLNQSRYNEIILVTGLFLFGIVFAVNSIIHSYLVLAYSDKTKASTDVGFYYMANAGGRLIGTLLSGWVYQSQGFVACLWWSAGFLVMAALISLWLPRVDKKSIGELR